MPPLKLNKSPDQTQPKTQPGPITATLLGLIKSLKNTLQLFRCDSNSRVLNFNLHRIGTGHQPDRDGTTLWRKLQSVIQQVGDDLEKSLWISRDQHRACRGPIDCDLFFLGRRGQARNKAANDFRDVDVGTRVQPELPGYHSGRVQQVIDHGHLDAGITIDDIDGLDDIFG